MLGSLSCIFTVRPGAPAQPAVMLGTLPDDFDAAGLPELTGDQAAFHRVGGRLAVLARGPSEQIVGYIFDDVPPATQLPALARRLAELARSVRPASPSGAPAAAGPSTAADLLASYIAKAEKRMSARSLLALCCDAIVNAGLARDCAVMLVRPGGQGPLVLSSLDMESARDAVADLFRRWRGDDAVEAQITSDDLAGEDLVREDTILLLDKCEAETAHISLPGAGEAGFAFLFLDPKSADLDRERRRLSTILELRCRTRRDYSKRRTYFQRGALAAAAVALIVLLLPTDRVVTASGVAQPADVQVISLHFPTYLDAMRVRVGDELAEGAAIAELSAPDQSDLRADTLFQISVEQAAANAALAEDDYGAYVLAQRRVSLQETRLQQIEARLSQLRPVAEEPGRVVAALSGGEAGRYLAAGTEIARLQTGGGYRFEFTLSPSDAGLLQVGQTGRLTLRGQLGEVYPIRVLTAPTPVDAGGETGAPPVLTASAIIEAESAPQILPGLSGYARIETGRTLRIRVWTRHIVEYIRVQAWILLNWRI